MKNKIITILFVLLLFLAGCAGVTETKRLKDVEITAYEGKRLDSITETLTSIKGAQDIDIEEYRLEIEGLVENPVQLTYDEVLANQKYEKVVELHCVEGWSADILWEGILLKDLFENVGVQEQANTVIFYAPDGYSTALPLDYIIENDIMIAYKANRVVLPPINGFPFQLVAEQKEGYKWIKWLTKIELSDDEDYLGYWESKGYSNEADVR